MDLQNIDEKWLIALVFGVIGFLGRTFIDFILNKRKKRIDLQELYWKEKIEAAKKATEYYLYQLGFFSLIADKYEAIEKGLIGAKEFVEHSEDTILKFQKRLLEFPHFEHFHINLFYEFNDSKTEEIIKSNNASAQKIFSITFNPKDDDDEFNRKFKVYKDNYGVLNDNHRELICIYKGCIKIIRDDIKTLPYK